MSSKNKNIKTTLHPRNKNRGRYDLDALIKAVPELDDYITPNKAGQPSVNFSDPQAVRLLNTALLHHYYGIKYWEIPEKNLCPPIPGRADYIHHIADLLGASNYGNIPKGDKITCIDIGMGASCIYPIIGVVEYGWNFIGSEVNLKAITSAQQIVENNPILKGKVECKLQENAKDFFYGIIDRKEKFDLSICNPPFHSSVKEAQKGTRRKVKNLSGIKERKPTQNFSGVSHEMIYEGGELRFITNMIRESKKFAAHCFWFSTLVSKKSNLNGVYKALDKVNAVEVKTIEMGTSNKASRIVAWTFLSKEVQHRWRELKWNDRKPKNTKNL